jgi:DNA-binding GntR family transcriptional regulator
MHVETTRARPPKYEKIRESLVHAMKSGKYQIGSQLPPQLELAKQYDVSLLTVRQALGLLEEEGFISQEPGRGTFVRQVSQQSVVKKELERNSVAYVLAEQEGCETSYQQTQLKVLDAMLAKRNRHLVFTTLTSNDIIRGNLPPALKNGAVAGVILSNYVQQIHVDFLKHHGFPLVVLGSYAIAESVANVVFNQRRAAYLMAEALLRLQKGLLYFVTEPFRFHYTQELLEGYSQACREHGQAEQLRTVMDELNEPGAEIQKIIHENTGPFSLFTQADIGHAMLDLFREHHLDIANHPVGHYGWADYLPLQKRSRLNPCGLDTGLASEVVVEVLDRVLADGFSGKLILEPELTVEGVGDSFEMKLTWHRP